MADSFVFVKAKDVGFEYYAYFVAGINVNGKRPIFILLGGFPSYHKLREQ